MKRFAITALCFLIFGANVVPAHAFNPNYLLSDWELTDPFALDFNQIQHYLNRGYLSDYFSEDWEGKMRYATDIIWRTAQNNLMSPKFILVLLQKEQSLIEDDDPTDKQLDWATGYGVCDDCSMDDPAIQRWKGFGKQVNSATLQFTEGYLADIENTGCTGNYCVGEEMTIDGTTVIPENAATAALYAYTPHLHGNENFVEIWSRWFTLPYPTGSLLQVDGESGVYLIEYGYRRAIMSWSSLLSRYNPDLIIEVSKTVLEAYPDGRSIDFPNYSLLTDEDGTIYLLVDDTLRPIDSIETFRFIGFAEDELVEISNDDVALFEIGSTITIESAYPQGNLLELTTNGAMFYIQDGERHPIFDDSILNARFPGQVATPAAPVEVEQYTEGDPLELPDGYLISLADDPTVYIISENERRAITSAEVFTSFGWSWDDIIVVPQVVLDMHDVGDPITDPLIETSGGS